MRLVQKLGQVSRAQHDKEEGQGRSLHGFLLGDLWLMLAFAEQRSQWNLGKRLPGLAYDARVGSH